jgi:hypothetical protein
VKEGLGGRWERYDPGRMTDVAEVIPVSEPHAKPARRRRRIAALSLLVLATAVLLSRLPAAIHDLDGQAARNARGGDRGRLLAAADTIDVDNDFVVAALSTLPADAHYAVLLPTSPEIAASSYGIGSLTLFGLPGYMQFILLPRRQVPPEEAQFVLCYACETGPWDHKTTWLWKNEHAVAIGRVNGS